MILVRSFPFMLKNNEFHGKEGVHWGRDDASPEISTSSGWSWRGVNPNSHSFASIWVVRGKDNWKKNKVYQIRCRKWNSVQVYQFRLNKVSNGRTSSNQQNRLQNVWLSSPFAQFVSPWAICGSVTPVLASLLCSWGSDIINCYTIKIYTKYYDYDCMWLLDESESLTTSYQIIFQIKHGQNPNVLRVGGCNWLRVSKLSCFLCPVTMRSDGGCPIAAFGRFLLTSTGIYLWCWGCAIVGYDIVPWDLLGVKWVFGTIGSRLSSGNLPQKFRSYCNWAIIFSVPITFTAWNIRNQPRPP